MHSFNAYLFTLINQGAGQWPLLDGFFIWLTSYITYSVIGLVLLYVLARPFTTHDPLQRLKRVGAAFEIGLSMFTTMVLVWVLKVIIAHPRPFVALADVQQLIHAAPYKSFPSMHAALTMALAISILPYHKHLGHLLLAFSFIVALSRLFVGVHYPFDIGMGLLIGYLIPKLVHRAFKK
jgi:undecaprenyl-diphosphatase